MACRRFLSLTLTYRLFLRLGVRRASVPSLNYPAGSWPGTFGQVTR